MSFWFHRFDQNSNENIVRISALKFCVASWGLPGSFFGLPGDLVSNIIKKEAYRKPQKLLGSPQEATKNFRAEIQKFFRWYFGWNDYFINTFWLCLTFIYRISMNCFYNFTKIPWNSYNLYHVFLARDFSKVLYYSSL